jgi:TonB-dependent SusC/RagA subfamily outer membrane receptor
LWQFLGTISAPPATATATAATGSPLEALAGKVAGLQIRGGAAPGSDVAIQIRSPTSVGGMDRPLIILDGVIQMGAASMDDIGLAADRIESIEVIRGAAAVQLYGQRAVNGVVNIRTRRNLRD